jgi:hypothetical protein
MSELIASRIQSTIAARHDLIQQLYTSPDFVHLDALFAHVLSTCSDDNRELAGKLLGTMTLLNAHVTPSLLATLLQLPLQEVMLPLQDFVHARVLITNTTMDLITDKTNLRVSHDSLRGFVVNPLRCRFTQYLVSPAKSHEALLCRCISLLSEHLRQDICEVRSPGVANADVPDLRTRIARYIPDAVRYACVVWPVHLAGSGSLSETVSAALLHFCTEHLLHWLEALSLLEELDSAHNHIPKVLAWCQVGVLFVT